MNAHRASIHLVVAGPIASIKRGPFHVHVHQAHLEMLTMESANLCDFLAALTLNVGKMKNACPVENASACPLSSLMFKMATDVEVRVTGSNVDSMPSAHPPIHPGAYAKQVPPAIP